MPRQPSSCARPLGGLGCVERRDVPVLAAPLVARSTSTNARSIDQLSPFLLVLALWIYAFIDCLNTPEEQVRGLPKVVWVIIILLFGEVLVGPVAWLVAGKQRGGAA